MARTDKAEKISITLPSEMLNEIKEQVKAGHYGSTSEVIREAMRLWQRQEEEHQERIASIRKRLKHSAKSGKQVPIKDAFGEIEKHHKKRMNAQNEKL
ncbi:MAG: type II toxin-antitoxin system ParD family antitoxin [Candidatus Nitronauta litoralis]|uniref:Type II toxin-antitoxin system ParD family antitoxin n=1 Tax=Candidatus Nitronauta litoralis TaxID=2705533 RepID=A0A7T0BV34_9BACT|nr:MAG: type II toxin-antitoxin system ParD family antitoxin [Candidatus Nitronauta litoralis]